MSCNGNVSNMYSICDPRRRDRAYIENVIFKNTYLKVWQNTKNLKIWNLSQCLTDLNSKLFNIFVGNFKNLPNFEIHVPKSYIFNISSLSSV